MEIDGSLPIEFLREVKQILGEGDYHHFLQAYSQERRWGLRVNTLKTSLQDFLARSPFDLQPIPWAPEGFLYSPQETPGKHPLHEAGAYYIQEPSAMAPVPFLEVEPGQKVLDLCAAPGGKATFLAARMRNSGLLVANEFTANRVKALGENLERLGVTNAIVTNAAAHELAAVFPGFFDRILVDAPCSGEGMFRKNPAAIEDWSPQKVALCANIQKELLDHAYLMLRPGGLIVYSTCTFNSQENEQVVEAFLQRHSDVELVKMHRLWPHTHPGEGHFLAKMIRHSTPSSPLPRPSFPPSLPRTQIRQAEEFLQQHLRYKLPGEYYRQGDNLFLVPEPLPQPVGIKLVRPGFWLGTMKVKRFEPSHALACALTASQTPHTLNLEADDPAVLDYLLGNPLRAPGPVPDGWVLITVNGLGLGWGKAVKGTVKNHYPKGLRIRWTTA